MHTNSANNNNSDESNENYLKNINEELDNLELDKEFMNCSCVLNFNQLFQDLSSDCDFENFLQNNPHIFFKSREKLRILVEEREKYAAMALESDEKSLPKNIKDVKEKDA